MSVVCSGRLRPEHVNPRWTDSLFDEFFNEYKTWAGGTIIALNTAKDTAGSGIVFRCIITYMRQRACMMYAETAAHLDKVHEVAFERTLQQYPKTYKAILGSMSEDLLEWHLAGRSITELVEGPPEAYADDWQ